jgi:uncharacterized protein
MSNQPSRTVLIAGGTGLIGKHLSQLLQNTGYKVIHLSRKPNPQAPFPAYAWDIERQYVDPTAWAQADYVINLAGSGIADKPWTKERKRDIIESRTKAAATIEHYLKTTPNKVKAYVSASAIGFYGNRGDELMHETDVAGTGFLSESTIAWENAVAPISQTGLRTVALRIGIVLSKQGGALPKLLIPTIFRVGTYFGDGSAMYAWIHIDDVCRMFVKAIEDERMNGIYNAVAPQPLTIYNLTRAIGSAKGGFFLFLPAPIFAIRLLMGELADVVANSTNVSSAKIEATGFQFQFPEAVEALKDIFKRKI